VTYLLKARNTEPEKQSLLANGSETTFVSRQQLDKLVLTATDIRVYATVRLLLETVFSTQSVHSGYNKIIGATKSVLYGSL
jgi:hypothetical protein